MMPGHKTMKSVGFLFKAPFILAMLFVINLMTSPGDWWVQWAALGIGIAWVIALMRVMRAVILAGGLAALGIWWLNRSGGAPSAARAPGTSPAGPGQPPDIPTVPVAKG